MNKEIQALERLINKCCDSCPYDGMVCEKATNDSCAAFRNYKMVKTALKKQEQDQPKLKAFDIIKKKDVDVVFVKRYKTVEEYNNAMDYIRENGGDFTEHLTQKEYELLRRFFK